MSQPLATCLRRQNELINLAITQVVEFPSAVGIGALVDHSVPCSIRATQVARRFAKLQPFRAISERMLGVFSAVQTAWRRERDSNPRYGFPYSGFQDRLFQPLTHPSARVRRKDALSSL